MSLSVIAAKDSAGAAIAAGLQAQDKSGAGTGPFTLGQVLIDGVAGTNMAQVTAANALKVDGSAVTQPVSGTITANIGTSGSLALEGGGNLATIATKVTALVTGTVLAAGSALVGIFKIGDGTNNAAIKAASTAAAATDPALVVALSPNNTALGAGATTAATIRTALASDSPGIIATGTAGSASATVLSVQGIAGATPQPVGGVTVVQAASSTITRPADTTAYTSGDLVANSVTAGSVTNLQFTTLARVSGGSGVIIGAQIQKSTNVVTNVALRLHLFNTAPTYTSAGDNSAISTVVVASAKGYLGYIDITTFVGFSDVAWGSGAPDNTRGGIPYVATAQIIYGLLEARGAFTPGNAEVFTISVDALQD